VTQVKFLECLVASTIGLLPLQLLNTYTGSTVRHMQDVVSDRIDNYLILSGQLLTSIFLMAYLLRKSRKEISKHSRLTDLEAGTVQS